MSYCPDCVSKDREIAKLSAEIDCGALCGKCLTCWQHSAVTMLERYKQASAENQRLREVHNPTSHAGDCTIYSALMNGNPEDGICTCGYGRSLVRNCDGSQMYSAEREAMERMIRNPTPSEQREEKI